MRKLTINKYCTYIYFLISYLQNNDTNEYNIVRSIMMEKVQLLVDLTHPINSKLDILTKFEKMQKKLLQQFNQLVISSADYLKAYNVHCDQAIVTAKDALGSNTEFDQYVHMVRSLC